MSIVETQRFLIDDQARVAAVTTLSDGLYVSAYTPLTMVHPRPDSESAAEYIYRNAHPGMAYDLPVAIGGGAYPFVCELSGAPSWLTVEKVFTGGGRYYWRLYGANPTAGTFTNITLTVTDQESNSVNVTFSIECSAARWSFFDATSGDNTTGTGTISNPYQNFRVWDNTNENTQALAGQICVYRTGTYATSNASPMFENGSRYAMGGNKPRAHMAYPGESVIFDMNEARFTFYVNGVNDICFHGIEFDNYNATIQRFIDIDVGAIRTLFYKCSADLTADTAGTGISNPAVFMTRNAVIHYYFAIMGCTFTGLYDHWVWEGYDTYDAVCEGNTISSSFNCGFYPKLGDMLRTTIRNNTGTSNTGYIVRADNYLDVQNIEISYNLFAGSGPGIQYGFEMLTRSGRWEFRNTFKISGGAAAIDVSNCGATTFVSHNSVIEHSSVFTNGIDDTDGDYTGVYEKWGLDLSTTNVTYTDANGLLTGNYRTYWLGSRGHEIADNKVALFEDDFASGDISKTTNGFAWTGQNAGSEDFCTMGTAPNGTPAIEFEYTGNLDLNDDAWSEQRLDFGRPYREFWLKWNLWVPNNFYHRRAIPGTAAASNNKLMIFWSGAYGATNANQQADFEYWPNEDGSSYGTCFPAAEQGNYNPGHIYLNENGERWNYFDLSDRGNVITWIVHCRVATPNNNDGLIELWKNGTRLFMLDTLPNYNSTGENNYRYGYLMGWSNSGWNETTIFHVDDVEFGVVDKWGVS